MKKFLDAQEDDYEIALNEIKNGHKRSHWIWYIFPQIDGLGQHWFVTYILVCYLLTAFLLSRLKLGRLGGVNSGFASSFVR